MVRYLPLTSQQPFCGQAQMIQTSRVSTHKPSLIPAQLSSVPVVSGGEGPLELNPQ